jgi:putative hemolysin
MVLFSAEKPFRINRPDHPNRMAPWLAKVLENVLCFSELNELYRQVGHENTPESFLEASLNILNLRVRFDPADLERIPPSGPVIAVSNHPTGLLDGMLLAHALHHVRKDIKIMVNYLLAQIPQTRQMCVFVDPFETARSARSSISGLKDALKWLKTGGMLIIFPSGEVSHINFRTGSVSDPSWNESIARLIRHTGATVLPAYIRGGNSVLFQLAGLVHPRFRTALLLREMLNKRDREFEVRFGSTIAPRHWQAFTEDRSLTAYLRQRTYLLSTRRPQTASDANPPFPIRLPIRRKVPPLPPILPAEKTEKWEAEIDRLPANQMLADSRGVAVYYADSRQIPCILYEIGRLREITFRETGEGTGRPIDIDEFDPHYLHLFVWHKKAREIVGGYRLGLTDAIMTASGRNGLYTGTLFRCASGFLDQISPAIELGRSFVRPEYQKDYTSLLMLWRGIGQFVMRHPRYKILFGPVSISNTYTSMSRELLIHFLQVNHPLPELAHLVRPRNRPKPRRRRRYKPDALSRMIGDVRELSTVIQNIEKDRKGVPILLRHYLKLGAKVLAFNVDRRFSNVLDALVLVDLTRTDPKVLRHYVPRDQIDAFLAYHQEIEE